MDRALPAGLAIGDRHVGHFYVPDRAHPGAGFAGAQPVPGEKVDRARRAFDDDVAVVHAVNDAAVAARDADARLHRAADFDVPEVNVPEVARGFRTELQAVAAGFEITI